MHLFNIDLVSSKTASHERSRHDQHLESRTHVIRAVDALRRLLKVRLLCVVDVDKVLWVTIHQWEPGTLDLHHDAVACAESMVGVRQRKVHASGLVWCERFGFLEIISELATDHVATH